MIVAYTKKAAKALRANQLWIHAFRTLERLSDMLDMASPIWGGGFFGRRPGRRRLAAVSAQISQAASWAADEEGTLARLKAARKAHPKASKKEIAQAAFYAILSAPDREPATAKKLHAFAIKTRSDL